VELFGITLLLVISIAPMIAVTVVSGRMGRRRLWQIGPWAAAVTLGLGIGSLIYAVSAETNPRAEAMASAWGGAALISGYLSTLGYLITLAIVGPVKPKVAIDGVF
jgi:hypothetical protein